MARKRPAPEAIEPTTAPKRGRASKAQKTGPTAPAQSTTRRKTVAQKKPRQAVQAPTEEEVSETKAGKQTASTKQNQTSVPKNQRSASTRQKRAADPEYGQEALPSKKQKKAAGPRSQKATASTRSKQSAASKNQKTTASTKQEQTSKDQKKVASTRQKQTAAPKSQRKTTSTRQKRAADSKEDQKAPPTKKQTKTVPAAAKPAPSTVQTPFVTPPPETKKDPSRPCAYSFEFFEDMARTIATNFPFADFAARHACNIHEVARVVSAIIVSPLSDPSFDWYDDEDLTIPSYVMMMMEMWERHYQRTLMANVPPVDSDDNTDRTEESDESGDGSSSDSDSGSSSTDSTHGSSTSSNRSVPWPSGSAGDFNEASRTGMSSVEQPKTSGNDTTTHCAENSGGETEKQVHGSDPASGAPEDEVSEEVRVTAFKARREPGLRRPKWVPADRPRVHVYKDEWGRYVPVPTKEEQEELERRQWLEQEARRIRQNRGRGMLEPSPHMQGGIEELDFLDLGVELEEENFGDVDLVDPELHGVMDDAYPALGGGNLRGEHFGGFTFGGCDVEPGCEKFGGRGSWEYPDVGVDVVDPTLE